jgi:hypothetical protein
MGMMLLAALLAASPARSQTPSLGPPPVGVTPPSLSQQLTSGLLPINQCPKGYLLSQTTFQNLHLVVCEVEHGLRDQCTVRGNGYQCGLGGEECCRSGSDNPCFPGAYACTAEGSNTRSACCMTR